MKSFTQHSSGQKHHEYLTYELAYQMKFSLYQVTLPCFNPVIFVRILFQDISKLLMKNSNIIIEKRRKKKVCVWRNKIAFKAKFSESFEYSPME